MVKTIFTLTTPSWRGTTEKLVSNTTTKSAVPLFPSTQRHKTLTSDKAWIKVTSLKHYLNSSWKCSTTLRFQVQVKERFILSVSCILLSWGSRYPELSFFLLLKPMKLAQPLPLLFSLGGGLPERSTLMSAAML